MVCTVNTEARKVLGILGSSIPAGQTCTYPARVVEPIFLSLYKRELVKENDAADYLMEALSISEWLEYTQMPVESLNKDRNFDICIHAYNWKET